MQTIDAAPRDELPLDELRNALSLTAGATVRHGVEVLTTGDVLTDEVVRIDADGGSITWGYRPPDRVSGQGSGVAAVRRRATISVPVSTTVPLGARRLRLYTEWLLSGGAWARFYLGVFVVTNPGALVDDGTRLARTLELADKSYLWATRLLTEPLHVAAGTAVVSYVKQDLSTRFGETSFALPASSATLGLATTFEAGMSLLEVYSRLLEAVGFDQLTADELGRPASEPLTDVTQRAIEHTYGAGRGKVVTAGQIEPLLPDMPNVVRFSARQGPSLGNVEGNGLRTVRNQSTGPASIDARGYEVEKRVEVEATTQAMLDAIAYADAQRYFAGGGQRWTGQVALNPLHSDRDVIGLELPRLGMAGSAWNVTEWTYPLGAITSEGDVLMPLTAERRVVLS